MHRDRFFAVVDLGATNVRVSYGNAEGLRDKISEKTDKESGPEGVAEQIIQMMELLHIKIAAIGAVPAISNLYRLGPFCEFFISLSIRFRCASTLAFLSGFSTSANSSPL